MYVHVCGIYRCTHPVGMSGGQRIMWVYFPLLYLDWGIRSLTGPIDCRSLCPDSPNCSLWGSVLSFLFDHKGPCGVVKTLSTILVVSKGRLIE